MPWRVRGWKAPARRRRATGSPRRVAISGGSLPRALRGSRPVPVPRPRTPPTDRPWTRVPPGWVGPLAEWGIYWYLTRHGIGPGRRKLRPGIDFFYQRGLNAPGLFRNKGFTRGDFILPWTGIVLDPINPFTHPARWFDIAKRRILALMGWRLIFIEDWMLTKQHPRRAVEAALRGTDLSTRGRGLR